MPKTNITTTVEDKVSIKISNCIYWDDVIKAIGEEHGDDQFFKAREETSEFTTELSNVISIIENKSEFDSEEDYNAELNDALYHLMEEWVDINIVMLSIINTRTNLVDLFESFTHYKLGRQLYRMRCHDPYIGAKDD